MQADDLREMFLAMTQEVRVIIVKLADRLHNMRTLGSLKPEKRVKISRETLLVFAPLAKLLGMYSVKNELEDLAFRWSNPEAHAETARWFDELPKRQEPTVRRAAGELLALCESDPFLKNACARVEVIPRAKELYGVYRKSQFMKKEERIDSKSTLAERLRSVREVAQLRVVLELDDADIADGGANGVSSRVCYHVLGLVHELASGSGQNERLHRHAQAQRVPRAAHGGAAHRRLQRASRRRDEQREREEGRVPDRAADPHRGCTAWRRAASRRTPR